MLMEIIMRVSGLMIKLMDLECINILKVLVTKEIGSQINKVGKELKLGQMVQNLLVLIEME